MRGNGVGRPLWGVRGTADGPQRTGAYRSSRSGLFCADVFQLLNYRLAGRSHPIKLLQTFSKRKSFITGLFKYEILCTEKASELGQVMVQGGGTFGTFMSIGTAIRC